MALNEKDFRLYKNQIQDDIEEHDMRLGEVNRPEDVVKAYEGRFKDRMVDDGIIENYLFVSANTVLPSLFFQLPKIIIRPKREELSFEAEVLNQLANIYFNEEAKRENQLAIVDAFLPYGYAIMKNGYNSRTGVVKKSILTGDTGKNKTDDMEGDVEYLRYEKPLLLRQSPKYTYLDKSQPFSKGNRITFQYSRTLQNLIDSNLYKLSNNFIKFFEGKTPNKDPREAELKLFEHWRMIDGYAWKLVYVEEWPDELSWKKTRYRELPVSYLRFNEMGDVLYSVSHGTLAYKAQNELNYLNELWKKKIDNLRDQFIVDLSSLTESGRKTLRNNDIGGIIETTKPVTAGVVSPIQSVQTDPNLFGNIQNVRDYLNLILSTSGVKAGGFPEKLATTERQKAMGDVLRASGMQDAIRVFVINQIRQMIVNILTFGSPEVTLKMTGKNIVFPQTGRILEPNTELQIGGENGFILQELITGDIDDDFIFDVDITSASRPDYPVIRKQLAEGIALAKSMEMDLAREGKKFDAEKAIKLYFSTFDQVPAAESLIEDMTPEEQMALQAAQQMAQMGEGRKAPGKPTEQEIVTGASKVKTGVENLQA